MARFTNSLFEKQTIYEIFRACRLCGAGGGYKMPIIQNVVDLDDSDVELKQKIRECVQIEVNTDDKMPPLICELCVDKINDFYEFLEMCRQTNKRTRLRLGLPPQMLPKGAPDAEDCILGVTEPVYVNDDSDEDEPLSKKPECRKPAPRSKKPEVVAKNSNAKTEKPPSRDSSSKSTSSREVKTKRGRSPSPSPPPKRVTRNIKDEDLKRKNENPRKLSTSSSVSESSKPSSKPASKPGPKSAIRRLQEKAAKTNADEESLQLRRFTKKRPLEKEKEPVKAPPPSKPGPASKKLRITPPTPPPAPPPPPPPPSFECSICRISVKTSPALTNHIRSHVPLHTSHKLACNACRDWFTTSEEASTHHKKHRSPSKPYICLTCYIEFTKYSSFNEHLAECLPYVEVPDVKCDECWREFPTGNLLAGHKCPGQDARPGGKCGQCKRYYALQKNLKKHESTCTKKKGEVKIDPEVKKQLLPMQIRVARCDPLLDRVIRQADMVHYDVGRVKTLYGLDKNCVYPYKSNSKIKVEPYDGMVNISNELLDSVDWDSDGSESSEDLSNICISTYDTTKPRKVESLSKLALKVLTLQRRLEKAARRKKKKAAKSEFDSIMTVSFTDKDIKKDIDSIIDNLDKKWDDDAFDSFANKSVDDTKKQDDNVSVSLLNLEPNDNVDALNVSKKTDSLVKVSEESKLAATADDSTDDELDISTVLNKETEVEKSDENQTNVKDDASGDKNESINTPIELNTRNDADGNESKNAEETLQESQTFTQYADVTENECDEKAIEEEDNTIESKPSTQRLDGLTNNTENFTEKEEKDNPENETPHATDNNLAESQTFTQYLDDFESDKNKGAPDQEGENGAPLETEEKISEENQNNKSTEDISKNIEEPRAEKSIDQTYSEETTSNETEPTNNALESTENIASRDEENAIDKSENRDISENRVRENVPNLDKPQENGVNIETKLPKKISEQEMYDKELMDALDEQIGETNTNSTTDNAKSAEDSEHVDKKQTETSNNDAQKHIDRSIELDNISDDDFNFDS